MGEVEDDDEGSSVEETIDKYLTASCLPMDSIQLGFGRNLKKSIRLLLEWQKTFLAYHLRLHRLKDFLVLSEKFLLH